jgi:hypothetical protein
VSGLFFSECRNATFKIGQVFFSPI